MNYLKHSIKVKYIDGLLAREQEWQWFVECIEKNYDISDIDTWNEYLSKNNAIKEPPVAFVTGGSLYFIPHSRPRRRRRGRAGRLLRQR